MDLHEQIAAHLRGLGQRYTPERQSIVQAMWAADRPVSMQEVLAGTSGVSLRSVYRVVLALEKMGFAHRVHDATQWTRCPRCSKSFGWCRDDGLRGQRCPCGYGFDFEEEQGTRFELRSEFHSAPGFADPVPSRSAAMPMYRSTLQEDWRRYAACRDIPIGHFFNDQRALEVGTCEAQEACRRCPVRTSCLEDAIARDDSGFRALTTYLERQAIARARRNGDEVVYA